MENNYTAQHARNRRDNWLDAVMTDPGLTYGQKLTAFGLSRTYNTDPENDKFMKSWQSAGAIGKRVNMAKGSVQNALVALRKAGFLQTVGRTTGGLGAHIYDLTLPESIAQWTPTTPHSGQGVHQPMEGDSTGELTKASSKASSKSITQSNGQNEGQPTDIDRFELMADLATDVFKKPYETQAHANDFKVTYQDAVDIFARHMKDERRTNWEATFKRYTKEAMKGGYIEPHGPLEEAAIELANEHSRLKANEPSYERYKPINPQPDWVTPGPSYERARPSWHERQEQARRRAEEWTPRTDIFEQEAPF